MCIRDRADAVKAVGKAKLSVPMNHPALPLNANDLLELGVGYTHVGPPPGSILYQSLSSRLKDIR